MRVFSGTFDIVERYKMTSIIERKDKLVSEFKALDDKDDRMRALILKGRSLEMPENLKLDQFLVKGCISRAWLVPQLKDGKIYFLADSEAMIVKGIIATLVEVYSGTTPEEVVELKPDFLVEVGIEDHLSMNRRNGLANITKLIQFYAEKAKGA